VLALIALGLIYQFHFRYEYLVLPGYSGYAATAEDTGEVSFTGGIIRIDHLTGHTCTVIPHSKLNPCPSPWYPF
jgi:hypothetical protein